MNLNALIRGQSNALLMVEADGWAGYGALAKKVEQLLGFDGVQDKVALEYSSADAGGANTANSGTAFLKDWISGTTGAWQVGRLEQGLLDFIEGLPAAQKAEPTAVVWLHSEYDSADWTLTAERWESGVRFDAELVRQAFGKSAAELPYLFVSAIPYWGTDQGHQAIRQGMEHLAADAGFNAGIAARALDLDMSNDDTDGNWQTTNYGGPHMAPADGRQTADRIALSLAQEWAEYAKPGSPVALAGGQVANLGPQVVQAAVAGGNQLALKVAFDAASALAGLDPDAAQGLGWTVQGADGATLHGTAAQLAGADTLLVTFDGALPADGKLYYGYGYGRLAAADGAGRGNAVYDDQGLPIWVQADGLKIGATGAAIPAQPAAPVATAPVQAPAPAAPTDAAPASPGTDWAAISKVVQDFHDSHGWWASYEEILAMGQPAATPAASPPSSPVTSAPVASAPAAPTEAATPASPGTDWAAISKVVQDFHDSHGWWASYEEILAMGQPAATPAASSAPAVLTLGSGPDALVLEISQDAWQVSAQYTVSVDGVQIGGTLTAGALHGSGAADTVTVRGDFAAGPHRLAIAFLNDAWAGTPQTDRNLHVEGVTFDDAAAPGGAVAVPEGTATLYTAGTHDFAFG